MSGLYGNGVPAADAVTKITTSTPANGKVRTYTVGVANDSGKAAKVWVWISAAATAAGVSRSELKVPGREVMATGEYERTGIVIGPGEHVYVKTNVLGVVFDVRGFDGKDTV